MNHLTYRFTVCDVLCELMRLKVQINYELGMVFVCVCGEIRELIIEQELGDSQRGYKSARLKNQTSTTGRSALLKA